MAICSPSDHPRACGANFPDGEIVRLDIGSSPRVRGKPTCLTVGPSNRRIIPARAGQTGASAKPTSSTPDHPRACGANDDIKAIKSQDAGSSPRVRGKRKEGTSIMASCRIIPARAGQTSRRPASAGCRSDHPRACGANGCALCEIFPMVGSSPRVRGKRMDTLAGRQPVRIIPARAGQTATSNLTANGASDHPRACGANRGLAISSRTLSGSSPRVRGKHLSM